MRSLLLSNWSSWHHAASATQWTEFERNTQSSTSPGGSSARLPAGLRPHQRLWCPNQSTWSAQAKTMWGKGRPGNLFSAPLASDSCMSDPLQLSISHLWPFNVSKCCQRNSLDNCLNIQKNTAPNIATKFARRGTVRRLLVSNWSSWHPAASATRWTEFESTNQTSTSPGESCARLPAGLRPHRHLWCHRRSTCSAQKRTVGIKGWQSVAAPLASDFCKSDHLQLSISHFWPFDNRVNIRTKNTPV